MLSTDIFEGIVHLTHRMSKGGNKIEYSAKFRNNNNLMIHIHSGAYSTEFEAQAAGRPPQSFLNVFYDYATLLFF